MTNDARMGTVVSAPAGGHATVLLDGAQDGSEVDMLTPVNYQPVVGDRVKVVRLCGQFVAEYAIGAYRG